MIALVCLLAAGPTFRDATAEWGLAGGNDAACWVDANADGWPDLAAGGALWINTGSGFERLADLGPSVAADVDNDGDPDFFCWSQLKLYRNDAGRALSEVPLPDLPPTVSRGAAWGDWNGDGYVDLYVGGYEDWERQITYPDLLLVNRGGTGFELAWSDAERRARGVTACDFDEDGDLDVYVSNYRLQPNRLWRNDGTGRFTDAAAELGAQATSEGFAGGHSIGAAWGDFDNDGGFDLFAGNFAHVDNRGDQPKSRFLRGLGAGAGWRFEDRGPCGIHYQESYASPAAGDADNDGDLDLVFTTVYAVASFGRPNHTVLFRNDGEFAFADVTAAAGLAELPPTYQAAWADVDRDGDLDLACAGRLFLNTTDAGHWLRVRLTGGGAVNRSAIGAQARVTCARGVLTRQVEAGTGEGNQNDLTLHFGLGEQTAPVRLEVRWPGGGATVLEAVPVDQEVTLTAPADGMQHPGV